jgi:hypothetical protein
MSTSFLQHRVDNFLNFKLKIEGESEPTSVPLLSLACLIIPLLASLKLA